jgi:1-acyl-sn-glycerol-3-phosphate acyltransferase
MPKTLSATPASEHRAARTSTKTALPVISPWMWRWFTWYSRRYLAQRFHALRVLADSLPTVAADEPLIVYLNHPSWYDPLVGIALADEFFATRQHYAPIDAAALAKYRFLSRLGFYPLERESRRGAVEFLRVSEALLAQDNTAIWLTPQGEFCDVRQRPPNFRPGLAHLTERLPRVTLLPLALEYVFWSESKAEILTAFGPPITLACSDPLRTTAQTQTLLEARLVAAQDHLAAAAQRREPEAFTTLLEGSAGVGGVYDWWRRGKAWLAGQAFDRRHIAEPKGDVRR